MYRNRMFVGCDHDTMYVSMVATLLRELFAVNCRFWSSFVLRDAVQQIILRNSTCYVPLGASLHRIAYAVRNLEPIFISWGHFAMITWSARIGVEFSALAALPALHGLPACIACTAWPAFIGESCAAIGSLIAKLLKLTSFDYCYSRLDGAYGNLWKHFNLKICWCAILFSDSALYCAFRCFDWQPPRMSSSREKINCVVLHRWISIYGSTPNDSFIFANCRSISETCHHFDYECLVVNVKMSVYWSIFWTWHAPKNLECETCFD
jgi:hypothetical protein